MTVYALAVHPALIIPMTLIAVILLGFGVMARNFSLFSAPYVKLNNLTYIATWSNSLPSMQSVWRDRGLTLEEERALGGGLYVFRIVKAGQASQAGDVLSAPEP